MKIFQSNHDGQPPCSHYILPDPPPENQASDDRRDGNPEATPGENTDTPIHDVPDNTGNQDGAEDAPNFPDPSPLLNKILSLAMALLQGQTTEADLSLLMNAADARAAIEAARAEGEIAGRNAAIEDSLASSSPLGAPDLNGTPAPESRRPASSIFDLAREAR